MSKKIKSKQVSSKQIFIFGLLVTLLLFVFGLILAVNAYRKYFSQIDIQNSSQEPILDWSFGDINTSDWKVYQNPEGLFTIKYPKNWTDFKNYIQNFDGDPNTYPSGIFFEVYENKDNLPSKEFIYKTFGKPMGGDDYHFANRPEYLKGLDVTVMDGLLGEGNPGPSIYIAKNNKVLQISSSAIDLDLYSKILSTLKFN